MHYALVRSFVRHLIDSYITHHTFRINVNTISSLQPHVLPLFVFISNSRLTNFHRFNSLQLTEYYLNGKRMTLNNIRNPFWFYYYWNDNNTQTVDFFHNGIWRGFFLLKFYRATEKMVIMFGTWFHYSAWKNSNCDGKAKRKISFAYA